MAITIFTEPDDIVAAYRPVRWEVQSDRVGIENYIINAVTSGTGAFARYENNLAQAHNFLVGDIVTGSTFTVGAYNVRQVVTVIVDAFKFETNIAFVSSDVGTFNMQLNNANFQIKSELFAINDETIKSIVGVTNPGGGNIDVEITNHGYVFTDLIEITNTTSYNGFFEILGAIGLDKFRVQATFVATETGNAQKLTLIGSKTQQLITVGSDDIFRFDESNFLQNITSFSLSPIGSSDIITPNNQSLKDYIIRFTEQFDDENGLIKDEDTLLSSIGTKKATNITLQHEEVQDLTVFTQDNTSKRFLTNIPANQLVSRSEHIQLSFLTSESQIRVERIQFDAAGASFTTILDTETIVNNRGIALIDASNLASDTVRFQIRLTDFAFAVKSETIQFLVDERCYDSPVRLWFLNRLGGMDAFTLTGHQKDEVRIKSSSYQRLIQQGFVKQDRGETTLGVNTDELFEVWTDFISREQGVWLAELFTSPVIFKQKGTDFIPIVAVSTRMNPFDGDTLVQVKFTYKLSNEVIIQSN